MRSLGQEALLDLVEKSHRRWKERVVTHTACICRKAAECKHKSSCLKQTMDMTQLKATAYDLQTGSFWVYLCFGQSDLNEPR